MTATRKYPLFDLRVLVEFYKRFGAFVAHCLETGSVVTADDRETVVSMIKELLEDEISFAIKHDNVRNLFSSAAPLDVWKKFTQASAKEKPIEIMLNIQIEEINLNEPEPERFIAQVA
jgi:hypothetical protein